MSSCRRRAIVNFGSIEIAGIQPIPFLNRIHPSRIEIKQTNEPINLAEFNFCKTSFYDIPSFEGTLALEESCEVWSEQVEGNYSGYHSRKLGSAKVLCGRVLHVGNGPEISIQDPCDLNVITTFFVTECFLRSLNTDLNGIKFLRGRQIRFLAVFWNEYGFSHYRPKLPEIILAQFVSEESARIDDLIGFLRVRERG